MRHRAYERNVSREVLLDPVTVSEFRYLTYVACYEIYGSAGFGTCGTPLVLAYMCVLVVFIVSSVACRLQKVSLETLIPLNNNITFCDRR